MNVHTALPVGRAPFWQKRSQRLLAVLLAVVLCLGLCPAALAADDTPRSGQIGESGTYWALDNGTLTISGAGPMDLGMPAPSYTDWPWYALQDQITALEIGSGVTTIGNNAFYQTRNLNTVNFAEGCRLATIGDLAFSMSGLNSITIPASVTEIGGHAFDYSRRLETLAFAPGSRLTTIGAGAFKDTKLMSITIPASVTTIGGSAFCMMHDSGVSSLVFEEGSRLKSIGGQAFMSSLKNGQFPLTIPAGVQSIGNNAFQSCDALTEVTFPDTLTGLGDSAFSFCENLKTLNFLGSTPPTIGYESFGDSAITTIRVPKGKEEDYKAILDSKYSGAVKGNYFATFSPNGGAGTGYTSIQEDGTPGAGTIQLPQCAFTAPEGKAFAGWSLSPSGGEVLAPGASVDLTATPSVTFYAIWQGPQLPPAPPPVQPTPPAPPVADDDDEEPTYAPSYEIIGKGKAVTNPRTPAAGQNVTLTLTPGEGWEVSTLRLSTRAGEVDATRNADGTYSYTQPEGRVTIRVVFREVWKNPFSDVPEDAWYLDALRQVLDRGLMSGMTDGTFNPDGTASRQQVWMILARLSGYQPADMAAAKAWATANGISDGSNPGGAVTRQQLWMLLARVAGERPADMAAAKAWAVANGISDGSNPGGPITRAQLAVMLQRFLER